MGLEGAGFTGCLLCIGVRLRSNHASLLYVTPTTYPGHIIPLCPKDAYESDPTTVTRTGSWKSGAEICGSVVLASVTSIFLHSQIYTYFPSALDGDPVGIFQTVLERDQESCLAFAHPAKSGDRHRFLARSTRRRLSEGGGAIFFRVQGDRAYGVLPGCVGAWPS